MLYCVHQPNMAVIKIESKKNNATPDGPFLEPEKEAQRLRQNFYVTSTFGNGFLIGAEKFYPERELLVALDHEIASLPGIFSIRRREISHKFILDCFDRLTGYMGSESYLNRIQECAQAGILQPTAPSAEEGKTPNDSACSADGRPGCQGDKKPIQ